MKIKKLLKNVTKGLLGIVLIILLIYSGFLVKWKLNSSNNKALLGVEAPLVSDGIKTFRDLNKNGKLDVYENSEASIENRVEDLISQMTIEEKAGSLFITMIGVNEEGTLMEHPTPSDFLSFLLNPSLEMIAKKHMNHFNTRAAHNKENMLAWYNAIQKVGEQPVLEFL